MLRCKLKSVVARITTHLKHCYAIKFCCCKLKKHVATSWTGFYFFNKYLICCSYYHPRNKFLRNKNLLNGSYQKHKNLSIDRVLQTDRPVVEPQSCSVQAKMFSLVIRPFVLLFWLHWPKHIFFLMYWRTSKNFHADFCPFPSLFTSRTNANRTLCKIIFKLFQEILNLQHRVSIAIASLFLCVCSCDLTWSFPKDMDSF